MLRYFIIILIATFGFCNKNINSSANSEIHMNNVRKISNITFQNINDRNTKANKKNAILGVIVRYSWKTISPFFKSLMKVDYKNCDIIMFVREVSFLVIKYLNYFGVIIYKIPDEYRRKKAPRYRWKMYIDFLKKEKDKYKLIISADVRDTIIQDDIFNYYEAHKPFIGFSTEASTLNQETNKGWIIKTFGKEIHKTIMNENIINAGTMIGTTNKYLEFAIELWNNLLLHPKATDQCIVNYLIYYKKFFNDYLILSNEFGPIMTIGFIPRENIKFDYQNNILNFNDDIAAWVHQYDRVRDVGKLMKEKFSPEIIDIEIKNRDILLFLIFLFFLSIFIFIKIKFTIYKTKINKKDNLNSHNNIFTDIEPI